VSIPVAPVPPAAPSSPARSAGPSPKRSRWFALVWLLPLGILLVVAAVLAAQWLRTLPEIQSFMRDYPGSTELPAGAPVGLPAWLGWQHFLNSFFLLFVFRTAWQLRWGGRPDAFWTRNNTGLLRTKNPPVRIGIPLWFHLVVDALWVLNGIVFVVLIFATGQWVRIVPLTWEIFPNAVSVGIQYASLDWPTDNGWVNYNALQVLSYFLTVFVAAPLAILTGIRIAPGLAARLRPLDRIVPLRQTKILHFAVMIWFVGFTIVHVTLVFATGALRNLNHMYASRDEISWVGAAIFAGSVVVMIVAWFAATPSVLAAIASRSGTVRQLQR
jgi:thiosulfate reductase cytochrome b subunit